MKRIIVRIDRLVLKGLRHEDRQAIAEGLREELGHIFTEAGSPLRWESRGSQAQLKAGGVRIAPGAEPNVIGQQTARSIAQEFSP